MKTKLIYYEDPYLTELKTKITAINETPDGNFNIQLEETIFYPTGGGQPGDRGVITGPNGKATLISQTVKDDKLIHKCRVEGNLSAGDEVTLNLDWEWRYKYMKLHTAGHLIHDILVTLPETQHLKPQKANHGDGAFIEYAGALSENIQVKEKLEQEIKTAIENNIVVVTGPATVEDLQKKGAIIPPNLPTHKSIRFIQIGNFTPMPDGGVQLRNVGEIGNVEITSLESTGETTKVTYQIITGKN